jgi:cell fate (sporulation/competence/biofilm development) regulator YmcA (YheA/YmcA/DUF963 family)
LEIVKLIQGREKIIKDINVVKLKVKQLKLLEKSPSNLKKSNIKEGIYTLGFKMEFCYIEHL